ncbi:MULTISPECIES: DUF6388 family protein [unclassified Vibrio]|uniref:DUF6388 family protein n=1 Tax=unclassified Vibrio TaxID=2614977 RepID=UPI002929DE4C|nr:MULTISPECIES: DUF6388 family protein [unclassified Vibrio]MDU9592408.1 hypothetical protein [Vibrio sp. 2-1-2a]MDU9604275.1 hypothetical protein [Vibrio sp. 1-2-3a]
MPNKEHYSRAHEVFLAQNPHVEQRLNSLDSKVSDSLGITIEQYRDQELKEEFRKFAKVSGLSVQDLVIELACETIEEKDSLRAQAKLQIEKALGIQSS